MCQSLECKSLGDYCILKNVPLSTVRSFGYVCTANVGGQHCPDPVRILSGITVWCLSVKIKFKFEIRTLEKPPDWKFQILTDRHRTVNPDRIWTALFADVCRMVRTSPNRSVFTRVPRSSRIKWLRQSFQKIQKGSKIFSIIIWVTFSVFKCTKKSCPSCCLCFGWNIIDNWNCELYQNKCATNWENVSWHVSS